MKLGGFETTADGAIINPLMRLARAAGAVGVHGGSVAQRDLVEFIRYLHKAHARGEVWTSPPDLGPAREVAALREKLAELQRWHEQTRMERDKFREDAADQRAKQEWLQRRLLLEESHAKMLYRQIETYQNASHVNRQQREPTVLTFWQWLRSRWT